MIIIGITGSIGTGKTTIASMLKSLRIPVFDSDQQVKLLLETDHLVIEKIYNTWPNTVSFEEKKINKLLLANIIFNNKRDRRILEKIIHPVIKNKRDVFIKKNKEFYIIGLDVPLLYETGTDKICDYVFLAYTSKKIQRKRVLLRDNMTLRKFNLINKSQWSHEKKKEKKPFVINTSFGKIISFVIIIFYLIKIIFNGKVKNDKRISS